MRNAVMPSTVSPKLLCSANTCSLSLPVGRSPMHAFLRKPVTSQLLHDKIESLRAGLRSVPEPGTELIA